MIKKNRIHFQWLNLIGKYSILILLVITNVSQQQFTSDLDHPFNQFDEQIHYNEEQQFFKIKINRTKVSNGTLRSIQLDENIKPKFRNKSLWNDFITWFQKEDQLFEQEVKNFLHSFGILQSEEVNTRNVKQLSNHPIVKQIFRQNLYNQENTMYYGPIWVGVPTQKLYVVYDTGSDWLVIESVFCKTCQNITFNRLNSKTWRNQSTNMSERLYGSAQLFGYEVSDNVSLDPFGQTEIKNFTFFEIYKQYGIPQNVDGILGMSRPMNNKSVYVTGPLFISYLYNRSIIKNQTFSFYIGNVQEQSYVDIGNIDQKSMRGGSMESSGFIWIKMPKDREILFWYGRAAGVRFGENVPSSAQYTFDTFIPAIFDTGTTAIIVPSKIAPDFFGRILEGQRYAQIGSLYQISCKSKENFKSIYLAIEGYWLEIHPDDYIIQREQNGTTGCVLGIQSSNYSYFILGGAFLRGYYTVHDLTNNQIGFAPHSSSNKKNIEIASNPPQKFSDYMSIPYIIIALQEIFGILTGWFVWPIVFALCFCITCCITSMLCFGKLYQTVQTVQENSELHSSEIPQILLKDFNLQI